MKKNPLKRALQISSVRMLNVRSDGFTWPQGIHRRAKSAADGFQSPLKDRENRSLRKSPTLQSFSDGTAGQFASQRIGREV